MVKKSLSISPGNREDELRWVLNKSKTYDVASGYRIAYHFYHSPLELCYEIMQQKTIWTALWKMKIPHNIKIFAWKILHGKLPALQQTHHRFQNNSPICRRCQLQKESIMHCIFQCPDSQQIWNRSSIAHMVPSPLCESAFSWWKDSIMPLENLSSNNSTLALILAWLVWKEICKRILNRKDLQ
ncbi:hypothetical protein PIB30_118422 [Stylosanthes scabra]|uniref:Reverse transcriptase zinc-binding domain-containing protein n=1 Tax=Stylosanthes scabra TaxID=79078 RepID=A0ABU6SK93_9FABA|nr:hypothetical protein [Stylosanthes scabra]